MAKHLVIGCRGLYTSPNRLTLPLGALSEATNLVIRRPDLVETRPGLQALGSGTWASGVALSLYVWNTASEGIYIYTYVSGTLYRTNTPYTASYTSVGSFNPTYGPGVEFAEAKECLYFTSTTGVQRMDSPTATPVVSGVQKPLGIATASSSATGAGFTTPGAVAYRATLSFTDNRNNVHESAPSSRGIYRWTGTTNAIDVTVRIPASLSTSYKLRLFRSAQTTAAEDEPSDELQLVYERFLTSSEVSAKAVVVSDIVPDSMRGASLYTNPSQQGIGQANERPPMCGDIVWHKNAMFYANTIGPHRLTLRLISVAGTNGLAADDTVTIAGTTYTAKASGATGDQFNLVTSFSGAQANVQATTINLVNAINASSNNTTVYAYYLSGADDPAGIFLVENRALGGSSFAATTSSGAETAWVPELPTSGSTVTSMNDAATNRVYISKPGEPESVPLLSYVDVGSRMDAISRIFKLRESVYVFKPNEGVFRITGGPGGYSVTEHDKTVGIAGHRTLADVGNEIYCLSWNGVVAISEAGARIVSGPIAESLSSALRSTAANTKNLAHAVADQSDGYYAVWVPSSGANALECYVYFPNAGPGGAWSNWNIQADASAPGNHTSGGNIVIPYIAKTGELVIRKKAASGAATDYRDASGTAIATAMTWAIQVAQNPGLLKQWTRADFMLQAGTITAATAAFSTELDASETTVTLAPASGAYLTTSPIPQSKQLGAFLNVSLDTAEESKKFVCGGLVLTYEEGGDNAGR